MGPSYIIKLTSQVQIKDKENSLTIKGLSDISLLCLEKHSIYKKIA